jgi:type IV secretory pathway component VirB8
MRGMDLARPRTALAVLCAASFLAVVDTIIVSIALPSIRSAQESPRFVTCLIFVI